MLIPVRPDKLQRSLTLLTACAFFIIVLGLAAIAGWLIHLPILTSIFNSYVTMKFNTALGLLMAGVAFWVLVRNNSAFSKTVFFICTICMGTIGAVTLCEFVFNWHSGIDQLFVTDYKTAAQGVDPPGRMSPSTACCFTLLSVGFLTIDSKNVFYRKCSQIIFHWITLISFLAVTGYLLEVPNAFKFIFFSSMAVNTALAFLVISLAASSINYNLGITRLFTGTGIGNIVARKLFPRMVFIMFLLGYISIKFERANYINAELGVILSTLSFILISLFLLWGTLNQMNRLDNERTKAENEIRMLNKNLEDIVLQRTVDLKQSNERYIKILNSNPAGIVIANAQTGKYVDVNPAFLTIMGYTVDEVIGKTTAELLIMEADKRKQIVEKLDSTGFMKNEAIVLTDKLNNEKHCRLSAEMLEYNNEKYMMSFIYDVSDLKTTEHNLQEAKKSQEVLTDKLTNQNRQLLSFAHIISHNLRSPVANLNLLVHFYKESVTDEDREDLWTNFETVIQHLNTTLDELLETLRIQEDIDKERELLKFEKVFEGVNNILIGQIRESGAIIKKDFSGCPEIEYPKIYLESTMMNLLSNAIKYRSPDRVPHITFVTNKINGQIILTVQDNGLGIDLNRHGKNMFGLRKTFHRHAEAKGLGLFITKTQIEAMGGEIKVESVVNEGTKFVVNFNKNHI